MPPKDFPNIIFDLGGVVLNLDYSRTIFAFQQLGISEFESSYSQLVQAGLFDDYERGEMTSNDFREGIRRAFRVEVSDTQIDEAWNAMLLNLPKERLELLQKLAETKRIVLLSNTNEIHIRKFNQALKLEHGLNDLSGYFQKLYYSYEVGMRKPDEQIFQHVLDEQGFDPAKTLFIDDSPQHIEGARKVGLNAYHLQVEKGETILDLF
ncbi:MAG: HAD family phosphatase [Flavobacteriales bacterium]|jgi:putative hydrolase of the HAD superfamily|nr:HAD family phosphatase [Flavobacteriales bacterium]